MTRKLFILSVLYFVQGLPYGFQVVALPVYLRAEGMSLTGIGLASALSLPWALKVIWGPPVDRYGSRRIGRRKSWILPLQAGLLLACLAAAAIEPGDGLATLLAAVFAMAVFASTMDVAVDGLAVDVLRPHELGYGNIAQVVGYKVGILFGGGILVWLSGSIGWRGLFLAMAALVGVGIAITFLYRERPPEASIARERPATMTGVLVALYRALRLPGTGWLLVFIGTYKLGESMADTMWKPFLYDAGFSAQEIGLWVGSWGLAFSLAGSFAGGVFASRAGVLPALAITATLRAVAVGGEWWLTLVEPTAGRAIAVIAGEQFFGGSLTTALFAFMMSRVDRRIGASHYTALATVEVFGKLAAAAVSGRIADATSYPALFGLATGLSFAFLLLLVPLFRAAREKRPAAG